MSQFPQTLKTWRKSRRFSQLALALEADVSARHISFLESGRSRPSADMIARLGDALQMPLSARSQMLTRAGYSARYAARGWDDAAMQPIRDAVRHMLTAHAPYPAMAVDRLWTVVDLNEPADRLFGLLQVGQGSSLLDLMMRPDLSDVIENWEDVAHHSAQRLRTESAAQGGVPELDRVAAILSDVPNPPALPDSPIIPTIYRAGPLRLSLFGTIAQFGTPCDMTLDDLKVELFFPADAETEQALRGLEGT